MQAAAEALLSQSAAKRCEEDEKGMEFRMAYEAFYGHVMAYLGGWAVVHPMYLHPVATKTVAFMVR